jgi:cytidylate kinase
MNTEPKDLNDLYWEAVEKNMIYASIIGNAIKSLRMITEASNEKATIEYAESSIKYLEKKLTWLGLTDAENKEYIRNTMIENRFQVLATPNEINKKPYLIEKGKDFTKEVAENYCKSCNKLWGRDIKFEVIPNGSVKI